MTVLTGVQRGPISTPRGPLVGGRFGETWLVDLLDMDEGAVGPLGKVRGGSLEFNVNAEIRSAGSLTVDDPADVDWQRSRVAIRYRFRDEAGEVHEDPLGVFLPTTSATGHGSAKSTAEIRLYDKMLLLSTDPVVETWTADKGTTVVEAVTAVLETVGEAARVIGPEDGGGTLTAAMVWGPGTSKLRVVNDILDAGYFFSIWVDGNGMWRLDPYVPPAARGVQWEHVEGPDAIFKATVQHEQDTFNVPNQVIVVGRADDGGDGAPPVPAPFAVAENNDPDDPLSIPGRGRVISHREDEQDATSEAVLGQIAARRLRDLQAVTSTFQVEHRWVPVDLNAAVVLRKPSSDVDALTVLQKWTWSWEARKRPGPVASTLREVRA